MDERSTLITWAVSVILASPRAKNALSGQESALLSALPSLLGCRADARLEYSPQNLWANSNDDGHVARLALAAMCNAIKTDDWPGLKTKLLDLFSHRLTSFHPGRPDA